jgi:DNA ligase (NAD+)
MKKQEYEELKAKIEYHMDRYYNMDEPEISDYEYDLLMQELKKAEKEHPTWVKKNSPSQKVGGKTKREAGVKVLHNVPMLSINDVFTYEDVESWVNKVLSLHPDALFSVEQKIDGLSMSLRYRRDAENPGKMRLELAETRGTGFEGEDVTLNALVIPSVQAELEADYDYLELRGEVYMTHEDFDRYNEEMEAKEKKTAANPRNLAAGTLRQLDPSITKERGLRMFIFNVQDGPAELMANHGSSLDFLKEHKVETVWHKICKNADEVLQTIGEIGEMRGDLPYDIDGAVVKIDQIEYRKDFPAGSKYSDGHIAYKYPPEERPVIMEEIEETVGRTGKIAFIGHVVDEETGKPARLCGTSVSRVTLHNQDYIREMKIGIGGVYTILKSGDIIPKLTGLVKEPKEIYEASSVCPVCGQTLEKEKDTADIRCINPLCPAQLTRTISYFTSRGCMDIAGLGETLVDSLVKEGFLKSYADIYRLKEQREKLIEKKIIGKEKNTDKILNAIEESKRNSPVQLLTGLGIRNVGRATAQELMKHFSSIQDLMKATEEELMEIPDIGGTTAHDIVSFFGNEADIKVMGELETHGLNMIMEEKEAGSTPFEGLTFVITGTLPDMDRKEAQRLIEEAGGKVTGSVSKKTNYLLAGENAGSKLTKANDLGVSVLSQEDLLNMLKEE